MRRRQSRSYRPELRTDPPSLAARFPATALSLSAVTYVLYPTPAYAKLLAEERGELLSHEASTGFVPVLRRSFGPCRVLYHFVASPISRPSPTSTLKILP